MIAELLSLGLSNEQNAKVLTICEDNNDYSVITNLKKAAVHAEDLKYCLEYVIARGSNEIGLIVKLTKANIREDQLKEALSILI